MRRKFKIYATIAIVLTGILSTACTVDFKDYNKDPNTMPLGKVPPLNLLPDIIFQGADGFVYRTWQLNGELIQYTVQMYTENVHRYIIRETYVSGAWNHLFRWASNADHMRQEAEFRNDANSLAIALTMRAFYMSNATDLFGDVPFAEAFAGRNEKENLKPKYDATKDIYIQLLEDLSKANTLYNTSKGLDDKSKDILFGGDLTKWRKFTNSLRLRMLLRLLNRDSELGVKAMIAQMLNNPSAYPVMVSNTDNATLFFTGVTPNINRFATETEASFTSNARKMSEFFINTMVNTGDPRIGIYAKQVNNEWNGLISGFPPTETVAANCANLNKDVLGDYTSPYSFMRYDELLFLKAEAAHKGIITGGEAKVGEYYRAAVLASIEHWDEINPSASYKITEAQKNQFLDNIEYNNSFEQIMLQKYVALYWCGYEAYHEHRRTGYPRLLIGTGTANDGVLPTRLPYPITSASTNRDNYNAAVQHMGGDDMKTSVWWSKRATDN